MSSTVKMAEVQKIVKLVNAHTAKYLKTNRRLTMLEAHVANLKRQVLAFVDSSTDSENQSQALTLLQSLEQPHSVTIDKLRSKLRREESGLIRLLSTVHKMQDNLKFQPTQPSFAKSPNHSIISTSSDDAHLLEISPADFANAVAASEPQQPSQEESSNETESDDIFAEPASEVVFEFPYVFSQSHFYRGQQEKMTEDLHYLHGELKTLFDSIEDNTSMLKFVCHTLGLCISSIQYADENTWKTCAEMHNSAVHHQLPNIDTSDFASLEPLESLLAQDYVQAINRTWQWQGGSVSMFIDCTKKWDEKLPEQFADQEGYAKFANVKALLNEFLSTDPGSQTKNFEEEMLKSAEYGFTMQRTDPLMRAIFHSGQLNRSLKKRRKVQK